MKKITLLLFCIFLLGCKTQKGKGADSPMGNSPIDTREGIKNTRFFFKEIHRKSKFKSLKINGKIDIETDDFIPTINSTIYIERNKKIWINLSSFFVNIARGLAEKKQFRGYLKVPQKRAIEGDYENLKSILGLDFLDYQALEKLLLGQTFIPVTASDYILTQNSQGYQLSSIRDIQLNTTKNEKYKIEWSYNQLFELEKVKINNLAQTEQIQIIFSNRTDFKGLKLPQNVKIIIKGEKNTAIFIENTKFGDSKMKTPFRIPKNYKKLKIND
ncbi:MAG: hypothetical protein CSA38_01070 [Flavobacteriales bacterium]|nr:MAG: hypothetical protein CSA38_01070 [Flavobacteriales bacterium]